MGQGRKSKFTPEVIQEICDILAVTGSDKQAYERVSIGSTTYYKWLNSGKEEFREFRERVAKARAEYRNSRSHAQIRLAQRALNSALTEGVVVETEFSESGNNKYGPYSKEGGRTVKKGVPRWAVEHVLGPPSSELHALVVLIRAGWFPLSILRFTDDELNGLKQRFQQAFEGVLPDGLNSSDSTGVLSEEFAEHIRQRILYPDT